MAGCKQKAKIGSRKNPMGFLVIYKRYVPE